MNILLVDDEALVLSELKRKVALEVPNAELYSFTKAREALSFAKENPIDIAFLDISMRSVSGIEMAKELLADRPGIEIIFCTGYADYAVDACNLHCSGYLLKPISQEDIRNALNNLKKAPVPASGRLSFHCFGNFDVFLNGVPVAFRYTKTKELLAYLVDREGAMCSRNEICVRLWEDDDHTEYFKKLRQDLIHTLEEIGCAQALNTSRGMLGIIADRVDCDFYDWVAGRRRAEGYTGEYMAQYSWAEVRNAQLNELC